MGAKRPTPNSEFWVNIQDAYLGATLRYFETKTIGGDARSGDHLFDTNVKEIIRVDVVNTTHVNTHAHMHARSMQGSQ